MSQKKRSTRSKFYSWVNVLRLSTILPYTKKDEQESEIQQVFLLLII